MNEMMNERMREHIQSLKRTIQYLCNQMDKAVEIIDEDPAMVKLMLKESTNQPQYKYK